MQRFWSFLAVGLGKHAVRVTFACLAVTVALGLGITQLDFRTSQDSYLNRSDQVYKDNVVYQRLFGGEAMLTVITMDRGHTVDELFTTSGIAALQRFADTLDGEKTTAAVVTPLTLLQFSDSLVQGSDGNTLTSPAGKALLAAQAEEKPGSPGAVARATDSIKTLTRIAAVPAGRRTLDNAAWAHFLVFNNQEKIRKALLGVFVDPTHAQIVSRLPGNGSIDAESKEANRVVALAKQLHLPHATTFTTGAPLLLQDINDYLQGGMLTLGAIAVAIMAVILLVLFHVRWRLLSLVVVLLGVVGAFGVAGYLGIPLTIVTIAGLPVMLGIGIDYAIQVHARVEEEVVVDRSEHPIQEMARGLGPALIVVTFDAIFAFLALQFAKVPMLRDFGLLLAVGIAVICVTSIVLPTAILGIREFRSPTVAHDFRGGVLSRLVVRLGSVPASFAIWLALASVVVFAAGIAVEGKLTLQTDPVQWVNQHTGTIEGIHHAERAVGGSSELGVYATGKDVFTDQFAAFAHQLTRSTLAKYPKPKLLTASSMETAIGDVIDDVPGGTDLAPRGIDVRNAYDVAPPDVRKSTVADNGTAFNIVFRTGPGSLDARAPVVRGIRHDTHPPAGIKATPSGLAVVGVGLLDNLNANRSELTYLALGFVFLFLTLRLRSVVRSLLSVVPVLIAVGVAALFEYALDLKLSPLTAVGGPLVVAACTEFTSLILLRFIEERRRGLEPREAVDVAASRTGRAFVVSALTAIVGVAVLSLSSLPLLRDFGRVVALNVTVALLSALVVLPPLLVWADRRNWVSRGLVERPEEPFIATPAMGGARTPAGAEPGS